MSEIEFMEAMVWVANVLDKFPECLFRRWKSIVRVKKSNKEMHNIFTLKLK